jgi:hypothetical protein
MTQKSFTLVSRENPNKAKTVKKIEIYLRIGLGGNTAYEKNTKVYGGNTQTFTNTYSAGDNILWNMQFCDSDGDCGFAVSNRTFSIDSSAPTINLSYPTALIDYGKLNGSLQLNFTATDTNLDDVWYNYNGTNVTIDGAVSGVYNQSNITLSTIKNVTIYANDTLGNLNTTIFSWDYKVFENSRTYTQNALSISLESFIINITTDGTSSPSAVFVYNGTSYTASKTTSGNNILFSSNIYTPAVETQTNLTFYWNITYGSTNIQTTPVNQTVSPISLTQCTAGTQFLTINIKDELTQSFLTGNVTINKLYFTYYTDNKNYYQILNGSYTQNNISFCLDPAWGTIDLWGEFSYESDGYIKRYYYFMGDELTNSTTTIDALSLEAARSTSFIVYLYDSSSVAVKNAYMILKKRYIEDNTYKTVEMAKTDEFGMSILHFITEDERYKIEFYDKEGNYLYETNDFPAACLDVICSLEFKLPYEYKANPFQELDTDNNFQYIISTTNESLSLVYSSLNSSAYDLLFKVFGVNIMNDTIELCSESENSVISGTLSCDVSSSGFSKFLVRVYLNGNLEISEYTSVEDNRWQGFGSTGLIIALFMAITFSLLLAWHWVLVIIGSVAGLIFSILMGFIAGSLVSATFLIVAIIYIIYIGGKR